MSATHVSRRQNGQFMAVNQYAAEAKATLRWKRCPPHRCGACAEGPSQRCRIRADGIPAAKRSRLSTNDGGTSSAQADLRGQGGAAGRLRGAGRRHRQMWSRRCQYRQSDRRGNMLRQRQPVRLRDSLPDRRTNAMIATGRGHTRITIPTGRGGGPNPHGLPGSASAVSMPAGAIAGLAPNRRARPYHRR